MKDKIKYIIFFIIIILIASNPSLKDFKEHLSTTANDTPKRENNFFICSSYSNEGITYFAIAGNFFKITPKPWTPPPGDVLLSDTTRIDTSKLPPPPPKKSDDPLGFLKKKNK